MVVLGSAMIFKSTFCNADLFTIIKIIGSLEQGKKI